VAFIRAREYEIVVESAEYKITGKPLFHDGLHIKSQKHSRELLAPLHSFSKGRSFSNLLCCSMLPLLRG
jgi:hypothetical protein